MPNIRGISGYTDLGAYSETTTLARSVSLPGGPRILCIIGLGYREETIVGSAVGSGEDGEASDFLSADTDGRHFQLANYPIVSNRLTLLKNGSELTGTEDETLNSGTFTPGVDYRVNISTGRIELKSASLVDQSGTGAGTYWRYVSGVTNVGDSLPTEITLRDSNAQSERWTIKCIDNEQDGYGNTLAGSAVFSCSGNVTGTIRSSANGQPILWRSSGAPSTTAGAGLVGGTARIVIYDSTFDLSDYLVYEQYTLVEVTDAGAQNGTYIIWDVDLDGYGSSSEQSLIVRNTDGVTSPSFTADSSVSLRIISSNGVLSFILDDTAAGTAFDVGDRFIVEVDSGVLQARDTLTARYIASTDVNDPEFFSNTEKLYEKHGHSRSGNTLAIGAQLAFANNAPGVLALQAKPPLPRKTDETVLAADDLTTSASEGASGNTALSDLTFDISWPGQPDADTEVILIVTNSDGTEEQIFPRKYAFYDSDVEADLGAEFTGVSVGAGTKTNSYTVINETVSLGNGFTQEQARLLITKDIALSAGQGLRIRYIDEKDADYFDANWTSALSALENQTPYFIVPLPNTAYSSVFQAVANHVETMSATAYRLERMALIGAIQGVTIDSLLGNETVAVEDIGVLEGIQGDDAEEILSGDIEDLQDYSIDTNWGGSYRVVYFYPDEIIVPVAGQNTVIDGFYIAAAAGGWLSAQQNVAIPLSRKNLAGFTILASKKPTPLQINQLGGAGACLLTPVLGGGKVRHGRTTTNSGAPEEEEISIVSIRDKLAQTLRDVLEGRFVGTVENATTAASMTNITTLVLNAFISQGLITQYSGLNVSRDDVEPRQWNVSVAVQPAYPVNWIWISVSVGVL